MAALASPMIVALPVTITERPGAENAARRAARQSATVILAREGWYGGAFRCGMGGDGAVGQMLRDHAGEAVGAAGGRGFHGVVEAVGEGGENRLEFSGVKAGCEGAAQFVFADGERGGPLPGLAGDGYGGFAHELERFGGIGARAEERGFLVFGQLGETAMEHRECDLAREVVEPVGGGVGERSEMLGVGISASEWK